MPAARRHACGATRGRTACRRAGPARRNEPSAPVSTAAPRPAHRAAGNRRRVRGAGSRARRSAPVLRHADGEPRDRRTQSPEPQHDVLAVLVGLEPLVFALEVWGAPASAPPVRGRPAEGCRLERAVVAGRRERNALFAEPTEEHEAATLRLRDAPDFGARDGSAARVEHTPGDEGPATSVSVPTSSVPPAGALRCRSSRGAWPRARTASINLPGRARPPSANLPAPAPLRVSRANSANRGFACRRRAPAGRSSRPRR